ncbi:MAG TPA: FimV/HubP family polar landmark protein [Casimicrobiaceae bacterium]|jgi:pilus assembly protein FimV|nr:FimV/HubP family polar landmark protein [Casimicrobiaceae bacterium]
MRAKPLIVWGLLAGVAVLPASALALGLGKLTVDSSLGQPLSARIELTLAQKDELDSLAAKVADISVYRNNNVAYPAVVSRARVTVEQSPNNAPYLKVTTTQAVNEPYLDLIVEVNWATGRVVRNYTFLLDPPGLGTMQAVEPVAPIRAQAAPPSRVRSTPAAAVPQAGEANTYTVHRGDTLSKIAKEYKPENVSLEQMLVALFRSNESAFDSKNMNRLRSGQILTIPPADQAATTSPTEATKVVHVQAADWRAYRDRVAAAAPTTGASENRQTAGGKITTAVQDKGEPAQAGKDQLRVSREAGKGTGVAAVQAEELAAKDRALAEANSRIAQLESTLKEAQKAIELKSPTMSDLQRQAEATKGGKAAEAPPPEPAKSGTAPATPPQAAAPASPTSATPPPAPATTTTTPPATVTPPATAPSSATAPPTVAPETKAPEAATPVPEAKAPETKAPETKAPPPAPAKVTKAAAKPEPSFIDELIGDTPLWAIGAGALGIVALIAGLFAARRRKTTKFEDSIISGTDIKTNTVFGSTGGGVVNTGDNSLASDFSREGLGSIDTDEVDPIAEAEVYLAYGRDAQAEEILKEALKKDPQRQEIYLKLLEIHAQHNKPSAFETVASELYSVSGGQGEVWQKAMALGRQLDPNNPLFAEAGGAAAFAAAAAAEGEHLEATKTADESVPAPASAAPAAAERLSDAKAAKGMDFTLDDDISLSPTSEVAPEPKTPAAILAGAAQEVARSTRAEPAAMKPAPSFSAAPPAKSDDTRATAALDSIAFEPESVPKFDLDFNLDQPSRPGPPIPSMPPASLRQLAPAQRPAVEPALAAVGAGAPAPQLTRPAAAIELDKLDLAFDPQRSTFEDPTPSVLDGQWHDAATKLDLAKAYQEMGDVEGAREILQEVLHEGDDQQKAEAKALLSKLA